MDGILLIDKPQDWTSFDVCNKIRHLSLTKKVGHAGTLDPFATGLLVVFLGKATKSIEQFVGGDKEYVGEMTLGMKTDTGDVTGKPVMSNVPLDIARGQMSNEGEIKKIFEKYIGEIEQVPPMYSAVQVNGQRLYKLARKGIEIERKARKINIYNLEMLGYGDDVRIGEVDVATAETVTPERNGLRNLNRINFKVSCSKGTYIRQLVIDIGDDLGCGAYLSKLQRTASHPFRISQALSMDAIINLAKIGQLETVLLPTEDFINIC